MKEDKNLLEMVTNATIDNRTLIQFGIIIGLLAIAFMSVSGNSIQVVGTNVNNTQPIGTNYFFHNNTSVNTPYTSKLMDSTYDITSPKQYVNYSSLTNGNTLIQTWTSNQLNFNLIPSDFQGIKLHALKIGGSGKHIVKLYYTFGIVNSVGGNYIQYGQSQLSQEILVNDTNVNMNFLIPDVQTELTDRITISIYANQIGTGQTPDLQLIYDDRTDARFTYPIGI